MRRVELKDPITEEEKEVVEQRRRARAERIGSNEMERMQRENTELLKKLKHQHYQGSIEAAKKVSSGQTNVDVKSLTKEEKEEILAKHMQKPKLSDLHII